MKRILSFLFLLSLIIVTFSGCVTRLGAFTVISTKNIDWSRAAEYKRVNTRTSGEDICHIIIFIPTKGNITIEDAVDNAIESVPGAVALVDAVLRSRFFYIPYIYGQSAYVVDGSVLIDPKLASISDTSKYYALYTNDGKSYTQKEISQDEYVNMRLKYNINSKKL
jgi:hypothetical protein